MAFANLRAWMRGAAPALVACVALVGLAAGGAARAEEPIFIPNFWDSAQKPDKPDLSALRVIRSSPRTTTRR